MAREVIEKLVDDLDGGEATETVMFALDGTSYEIDLSKKNAAAFRKSFERYIKAARRSSTGGARRRKAAVSTNGSKPKREFDITQLREWAGANNVTVPARGGSRKPSWTSTSKLAAAEAHLTQRPIGSMCATALRIPGDVRLGAEPLARSHAAASVSAVNQDHIGRPRATG